ncbi:hypothetical protein [Streptomyces sp. cmx-4-7]|uniref:hypothetical protein n=1 Tax=Streptomyces sp. cmx-4-7 TaxID=2790939 RepID=UPI0039809E9C
MVPTWRVAPARVEDCVTAGHRTGLPGLIETPGRFLAVLALLTAAEAREATEPLPLVARLAPAGAVPETPTAGTARRVQVVRTAARWCGSGWTVVPTTTARRRARTASGAPKSTTSGSPGIFSWATCGSRMRSTVGLVPPGPRWRAGFESHEGMVGTLSAARKGGPGSSAVARTPPPVATAVAGRANPVRPRGTRSSWRQGSR